MQGRRVQSLGGVTSKIHICLPFQHQEGDNMTKEVVPD